MHNPGVDTVRHAVSLPLLVARCYGACARVTPHVLRLLITPKVLSSERARAELGFAPRYPGIRTGLEATLHGL